MSERLSLRNETAEALVYALETLSELKGGIILRHDPLRESNKWTIIYECKRLCDTDDPIGEINKLFGWNR